MLVEANQFYKLYKCSASIEHMTQVAERADGRNPNHPLRHTLLFDYTEDDHLLDTVCKDINNEFKLLPSVSVYRYNSMEGLRPHVDCNNIGGRLIIALEGVLTTKFYSDPVPESGYFDNTPFFDETGDVVAEVTYAPGEMLALNNTKWVHSTHPHDAKRVNLAFEIVKDSCYFE